MALSALSMEGQYLTGSERECTSYLLLRTGYLESALANSPWPPGAREADHTIMGSLRYKYKQAWGSQMDPKTIRKPTCNAVVDDVNGSTSQAMLCLLAIRVALYILGSGFPRRVARGRISREPWGGRMTIPSRAAKSHRNRSCEPHVQVESPSCCFRQVSGLPGTSPRAPLRPGYWSSSFRGIASFNPRPLQTRSLLAHAISRHYRVAYW